MERVLVVGREDEGSQTVLAALAVMKAEPLLASSLPAAHERLANGASSLVAVDLALCAPHHPEMTRFLAACKKLSPEIPVLALISEQSLAAYDSMQPFDDFACSPWSAQELASRMRLLLRRFAPAGDPTVIRIENLVIDLARYEVAQDGKRMNLTFKEYELLKFLATNPGKVFTRETLLNRVWGYDYFGGTRTVDVHIRRLRSKIESGTTTFIDTVRNVGYRFREPA